MSVIEQNATVNQEIKTDSGDVAAEIINAGATKQYSFVSWTENERGVRPIRRKNGSYKLVFSKNALHG